MASTTTIAATVAEAASSAPIVLTDGETIKVHASGRLNASEYVRLEESADDGATWSPVRDDKYGGTVLKDTVGTQWVTGPGTFQLVKSPTVAAIAVYYD